MPRDKALVCLYGLTALGALVATWSQNIRHFTRDEGGGVADFLRDMYANPAASSIANDVLFIAVAAVVFMIVEGIRLRMRFLWAYLLAAPLVAISVAFPLFLMVRQLKLAGQRGLDEGL